VTADDTELMLAAARGDTTAFERIVRGYGGWLVNFFVRRGVSKEDGEDLAQRTFLRLWNYRDRYTAGAKLGTFLFLLAQQTAVDHFRSEARRRRLAEELVREAETRPAPAVERPYAEGNDIRSAVARLPAEHRAVVELGVFLDRPYADIAAALGIPVGTVKSRMFNALKKLKEMLGERRS